MNLHEERKTYVYFVSWMLSEVIKKNWFWKYKHIGKASGILAQNWPQKSSVKFGKISLGGHACTPPQLNI